MRPNIIFFLIDGLRSEQFYGNNRTCKTPNIDSLVNKGMYFEPKLEHAVDFGKKNPSKINS